MATTDEVRRESARRQSLFRSVNDRVRELGGVDLLEFLCECASLECHETMSVPVEEYDRIRLVPTRFLVKPRHLLPDVEHVLAATDGYTVVEKVGEGAALAVELGARRSAS